MLQLTPATSLPPAEHAGGPALQRARGEVRLAFKRRDGRSVLDEVHQAGCCKVRFPRPEPGAAPEAVLINTAGGLTDGDRIETRIAWGTGTLATVTSQAAERIYKSRGAPARVHTGIDVAEGATALWLPQETILFDGGRLTRRLDADIAEGGRLIGCESTVFGRHAMGETVRNGALHDSWRVRYAGRLVFADGFGLDGTIDETLARPAAAGGASAIASIVYAGPGAGDLVDAMRGVLADLETRTGCSVTGPVLLVRILGQSGKAMRRDLVTVLGALIARATQCKNPQDEDPPAAALPRVWSC